MARIPRFLTRHSMLVEPYLGWNTYGAATPVRCFYDPKITDRFTQAGVAVHESISLYCVPEANVPTGSRLTLPDGRSAYAAASARRGGGGLPTPDHVEVAAELATAVGPPHGETVVLLRRTIIGTDRFGSDRYNTAEVPVAGVAVRALGSQEGDSEGRDTVTDSLELVFPPGTAVTPVDRVRVRGLTYSVDGTPEVVHDSVTGAQPGVRVIARRTTG